MGPLFICGDGSEVAALICFAGPPPSRPLPELAPPVPGSANSLRGPLEQVAEDVGATPLAATCLRQLPGGPLRLKRVDGRLWLELLSLEGRTSGG